MTREEFSTLSKGHILYLDGATGSNLVKAGMPSGVCPEQWILEHRDVMLKLQKDYVQAGPIFLMELLFKTTGIRRAEIIWRKKCPPLTTSRVENPGREGGTGPGIHFWEAGISQRTGGT